MRSVVNQKFLYFYSSLSNAGDAQRTLAQTIRISNETHRFSGRLWRKIDARLHGWCNTDAYLMFYWAAVCALAQHCPWNIVVVDVWRYTIHEEANVAVGVLCLVCIVHQKWRGTFPRACLSVRVGHCGEPTWHIVQYLEILVNSLISIFAKKCIAFRSEK